jgi:hypothetical protein
MVVFIILDSNSLLPMLPGIACTLFGALFGAGFLISLMPFGGDIAVLIGVVPGAIFGGYIGYTTYKKVFLRGTLW